MLTCAETNSSGMALSTPTTRSAPLPPLTQPSWRPKNKMRAIEKAPGRLPRVGGMHWISEPHQDIADGAVVSMASRPPRSCGQKIAPELLVSFRLVSMFTQTLLHDYGYSVDEIRDAARLFCRGLSIAPEPVDIGFVLLRTSRIGFNPGARSY